MKWKVSWKEPNETHPPLDSDPLPARPRLSAQEAPQGQQAQTLPPIEVFFSPKGGCTEAVVKELAVAKSTILVQAYSFTSAPIAKALVDAHSPTGQRKSPRHSATPRRDCFRLSPFLLPFAETRPIDRGIATGENHAIEPALPTLWKG